MGELIGTPTNSITFPCQCSKATKKLKDPHVETKTSLLKLTGTSLVVQWLRLRAAYAGGPGSIPDQGARSHMPQLNIPHAATEKKDPACCNKDPACHS